MEHVFSIKSPVTQMVHFGKLSFYIGAKHSGITSTTKMFFFLFFFLDFHLELSTLSINFSIKLFLPMISEMKNSFMPPPRKISIFR